MKNLIVLLVLLSFVLVPFNTNASNIDYSKTEIKVSWKNYTLTKVKDLLYKNITNKVNLKQTESLKIDSYNSFIKTLDKIIIQAKKSSKTQNIHLWYMLEDLKQDLILDLEKITNKTSQIKDKKEVLENTNIDEIKIKYQNSIWNITLSEKFEIFNSPYIPCWLDIPWLEQALINLKTKDVTNDSLVSKVMWYAWSMNYGGRKVKFDMADILRDIKKINKSYFSNPSFSFDYVNPLLNNINIDKNELKSLRAFASNEWKSKLVSVQFFWLNNWDYSNVDILEFYDNWQTLSYWISWIFYNKWVKIDENLEITTDLDWYAKQWLWGTIVWEWKTINEWSEFYKSLVKKEYWNSIKMDFWWDNIVNRDDNKLINWVDYNAISKQRALTSENWKAKIIKIILHTEWDWMWIEVIEYYSNWNSFWFWYAWMWLTNVSKSTIYKENWWFTARVTQVNWVKPWQNFLWCEY